MHKLGYSAIPCSTEAHLGHGGDMNGDEPTPKESGRSQGQSSGKGTIFGIWKERHLSRQATGGQVWLVYEV